MVQVLSNIGEDLTPTEKAEALEEIRRAEPRLTTADLAGRLGVPEAQVKFLTQLCTAPAFIRALGTGPGALPLWNLVTLLRLYRKLRRWDDAQFRDTEGAHERVADREVRRLGDRARRDGWGKRKLQSEAERIAGRVMGERKRGGGDALASIRRWLGKVDGLSAGDQTELCELLRETLDRLAEGAAKRGRRRRPASAVH